jgi:hypothetical protein
MKLTEAAEAAELSVRTNLDVNAKNSETSD